ncbi:MAG: hypothetical protein KA807_11650 [Prolixibacteraceae bacterium]|nr:hypothetical protein [Prolixibacteraceae bacterium]
MITECETPFLNIYIENIYFDFCNDAFYIIGFLHDNYKKVNYADLIIGTTENETGGFVKV